MRMTLTKWRGGIVVAALLVMLQIPTSAHATGAGALTGGVVYDPSLTMASMTRDVSYAFAIAGVETIVGLMNLDCHLDGSSSGDLVSDGASAVGTCVDVRSGLSASCAALVQRVAAIGNLQMSCLTPWGPLQITGGLGFVPLTAPSGGSFAISGLVFSQ